MDRIEKLKALSPTPANAEADIDLINQYSTKTLSPDEVFCFSVILCDNEVDRDNERFTITSLDKMVPLFIGKPVLMDHRWSAEKQTARLYRCELVDLEGKTALGEQKKGIRGSAYMLRNEAAKPVVEAIEGGILKEVSVGCSMGACECSICGEAFVYYWQTGKEICKNDHIKGAKSEDGKLCVGDLVDPKDAYELSFVAVPAQKGVGVTKGLDPEEIGKMTTTEKKELINKILVSLSNDEEITERAKILAENKKFIGGK